MLKDIGTGKRKFVNYKLWSSMYVFADRRRFFPSHGCNCVYIFHYPAQVFKLPKCNLR